MNSGDSYKENLDFNFLFRLKSSCIPNMIPLACLIIEIYMKETLKLGFVRRPHHNFIISLSLYLLVMLKSSCKLRISLLAFLRRPQFSFAIFILHADQPTDQQTDKTTYRSELKNTQTVFTQIHSQLFRFITLPKVQGKNNQTRTHVVHVLSMK